MSAIDIGTRVYVYAVGVDVRKSYVTKVTKTRITVDGQQYRRAPTKGRKAYTHWRREHRTGIMYALSRIGGKCGDRIEVADDRDSQGRGPGCAQSGGEMSDKSDKRISDLEAENQELTEYLEHLRDTRDDRNQPLADVVRSVATDPRLALDLSEMLTAEELAESLRGKLIDWLSALRLRADSREIWKRRALAAEAERDILRAHPPATSGTQIERK